MTLKINSKDITSWTVNPQKTSLLDFSDQNLSMILTDGKMNTFTLSRRGGDKWPIAVGEVTITFKLDVPVFGWATLTTAIKQMILMSRKNIEELTPIPRDDMSMYQFLKEAPGWFTIVYIGVHPWEIYLVYAHNRHNLVAMVTALLCVKELNAEARKFRADLIKTENDYPRKNAYRHSYWMATTTRALGASFANDLGNMHEDCHRDLTIEGPFDHVTDRINNTVGIKLAQQNPTRDIEAMIDEAWKLLHLAVARNFRTENGIQTADVQWQEPLNYLSNTFHVIPAFSDREKATLKKMNINVPNEQTINDELPKIAETYDELDDDTLAVW